MSEKGSKNIVLRWSATLIIAAIFFLVGLIYSIRGPALLDLADYAGGVPVDKFSLVFLMCSVGFVMGSIIVGLVFDYCPHYRITYYSTMLLIACLSCSAITLFPGDFFVICILFAVQSITLSSLQDGSSILCMEVWSGSNRSCEPYLYFCGFLYYVGCFVSPFLASPFLATRSKILDQGDGHANTSVIMANETGVNGRSPLLLDEVEELEDVELIGTTKVQYAYLASGVMVSVVFILFTCFYGIWGRAIMSSKKTVAKTDVAKKELNKLAPEKYVPSGLPCYFGMSMVIFILYGIQITFGTFLTTFCVLGPLQSTSQVGALITSIYFSSQGVSSVSMVFISTILSPVQIMFMCLTIILVGCIAAVTLGGTYYYGLIITAVLLGLGNSSILCTAYMWLKSHELPVYGRVVATLTLSASLGSELLPALVGQYIEDNPLVLMWSLLVGILTAWLIMLTMTSCIGIRGHWIKIRAENSFDYKILAAMEEDSKESEEALRRFLDDY